MKTVLAWIGAFVVTLGILGALNIGNFVLIYSADKVTCTKEPQ